MTTKPILFKGEMARKSGDGSKTQTRRVVTRVNGIGAVTEFQPSDTPGYDWIMRDSRMLWNDLRHEDLLKRAPLGQPGDRLWCREPARVITWHYRNNSEPPYIGVEYSDGGEGFIQLPSRFSNNGSRPRWVDKYQGVPNGCIREMARTFLEIESVRVELLQDIDDPHDQILKEGWPFDGIAYDHPIKDFIAFWDSFAKPGEQWKDNRYVWVYEFRHLPQLEAS